MNRDRSASNLKQVAKEQHCFKKVQVGQESSSPYVLEEGQT